MSAPGFKFIDLPTSAERLGVTRTELLRWVDEGRIKPFSGKGQQSVFRAGDVEKIVAQRKQEQAAESEAIALDEAEPQAEGSTTPSRVRRRDPVKLIGTRLSMDSRWAEISDADIATWVDATEMVQFERVRKVANITMERLNKVLAAMEERSK